MKKSIIKYGQLACLISLIYIGVTGCTKEDNLAGEQNATEKVRITGYIEDAVTADSRAGEEQPTDQFGSYTSGGFKMGQQIGFYSEKNNDGATPAFSNECLTYTSESDEGHYQTFKSDNLIPEKAAYWGKVFVYYPYNDQNTGNDINIYKDDGSVIDLLTSTSIGPNGGNLSFCFTHAFSMLFIFPSERGFKNAISQNSNGIKVVLEQGIENVTVNSARTDLIFNPAESDEHTSFTAVKNTAEFSTPGWGEHAKESFFYVLLPSGTTIKHIEIVDDFGRTQYVRPVETLTMQKNTRHAVTIQMTGDEPTLWPWEVAEWNSENEDIKVDDNPGIYSTDDFNSWISAYNSYCSETTPNPEGENGLELKKYGDFGETNEGKWTFFLRNDIDCSGYTFSEFITTFDGVLDGLNHTLSNVTLNGETPGFIGTLTGTLQNLKVDNVNIYATQADAPIGTLANQMTGGTITNCDVTKFLIEANGPVGAIAGAITSGSTITDNTYKNGELIGTESKDNTYIVGTQEGEMPLTGNRYADVLFHPITNETE